MHLSDYQRQAVATDLTPGHVGPALIVPLLGLAGEAGTLLSEYKKYLRDGEAHVLYKERVGEELGDILWYLSNVATKYGLDLDDVAEANLVKVRGRWSGHGRDQSGLGGAPVFDAGYPEAERLPRRFEVEITESEDAGKLRVCARLNGIQLGDTLTDNAYDPDGYRFHDAFHLAYAAVLGWSPVVRKLLGRKRRSNPVVDEVEDGGRAFVIEEGISAVGFDYAKVHAFLEGVTALDGRLMRTMMGVTSHLEVGRCAVAEWELAILEGFEVWRQLLAQRGGWLVLDLDARSIIFRSTRPA